MQSSQDYNNNNNNNNNNIAKPPRPTLAANATHKKHYNEQVKKGYIDPLWRPSSNKDITNPKALALRSQGPGTVSVLFQGGLTDGIGSIFSISTTSKVSQELEEKSLVVGRVLEGMEVISQIDQIPTFRPSGTFTQVERSFNLIGGALGDQRAARARESWVKPKITVLIMDSGILAP